MVARHVLDLVVFDFDGVIADTVQDIATAANDVLRHYRMAALPVAEVRSSIGGGAEALVRNILAGREDIPLDEAAGLFKERYRRCHADQTELYPGVREVLDQLEAAGKTMAIATNKMEALTHNLVAKLGVQRYFRMIVGPESISRRKPDPEAVTRILDAVGVVSGRALMIGDTADDIVSGRAAGTLTCAVLYGYGGETELARSRPDFSIRRIGEVLDHIADDGPA